MYLTFSCNYLHNSVQLSSLMNALNTTISEEIEKTE